MSYKIKTLQLTFENCECIEIPMKAIEKFSYMHGELILQLNQKASRIAAPISDISLFKRLAYEDLTHIYLLDQNGKDVVADYISWPDDWNCYNTGTRSIFQDFDEDTLTFTCYKNFNFPKKYLKLLKDNKLTKDNLIKSIKKDSNIDIKRIDKLINQFELFLHSILSCSNKELNKILYTNKKEIKKIIKLQRYNFSQVVMSFENKN